MPDGVRGEDDVTAINDVIDLSRDGDIAVVTINSPPVNALSAKVRTGISEALAAAIADTEVRAIVIHCEGRTFIAGADITEFGKPPQGVPLAQVEAEIEAAPKPVVAAIHGTAFGGGLELTLACHYRVAVPSAKLGLPEVKLGLVPGAGGTQRLPRIVGVERALEVIAFGEPMSAAEAAGAGLVDEMAAEASLKADAVAFARKLLGDGAPLNKVRDRSEKLDAAKADPEVFARFRKANARRFRGFEAPEACIRCVEAAVTMPFEEGLKFERAQFMQLVAGTQSVAQRYVFFAERQAAKIPDVPETTPVRSIRKVGVIGAGTMGGGIAMNFANVGIPVTIVETKPEALDRGLSVIRKNYETSAKRGRLSLADVETRMGQLAGSLDLSALADCDLVIEAVFENMAIKKEVFGKLNAIVKQGAILASNTSYLDVDEIASATTRPEDVIGLHFFSPANVMRLLEVVRGEKTAKDVVATAMQMARKIGKVAVLVGVCHGFVGNRMLAQRQREANKLILEGAMPWDVDRVLYDFGLPMGPFAMSDLAGLDIGWSRETSKGETVREILCEMDRRGQKTGAGFYDYDENRTAKPSEVTEKIILDLAAKKGVNRRPISDEEILQRCIYPMINEGAKILEEGKAIRASDIDIVWINGYGWPVYRGGPMFYADTVGLAHVLETLKEFEGRHGPDFKPSALLEKLVAEGGSLKGLEGGARA
jgi:3-hydroxyacyl-CoA dehydrogenase